MENTGKRYFTTITGEWILKVTGEGKWLVIMSRGRSYTCEVQSHVFTTFEIEYRFYLLTYYALIYLLTYSLTHSLIS